MKLIMASEQGSHGGRREGRHKAVRAWRARVPRLRLLALVPLTLPAALVAANALAGQDPAADAASSLLVTISPSVPAATRPPGDRPARAARRTAPAPAATVSSSSTRNGVGCTGPGTKAARALALRVQTKVGPPLRSAGTRVAFAVEDSLTGVRCSVRGTRRYDSASVVKVSIVAALLVQRRAQGRSLSSAERSWARRAITTSDNAAASALWRAVGGAAGMSRFFERAGMTRTVAGAGGYWGLTQVTAGDQLTLLRHVTRRGLLARTDRRYLQDLMASVIPSQRWGVPVGAPSSARVGNKNGWLHRSTRAWRVHSIGWVELHTTTYDVVLLSDGSTSLTSGIRRLDTVARAVHSALGRAGRGLAGRDEDDQQGG